MIKCDYGCGKEAKHQLKNGKWCCSASSNSCFEVRKKKSKSMEGKIPWNKGIPCLEETRKKQRESMKGKIPWNKGKKGPPCSEEMKKKISESMKGQNKGKTYTIEQWQEKYPDFCRAEEMRYNPYKLPEKEIQVHCKFSKCENSKEKSGWFTPEQFQFWRRRDALEHDDGNDGCYLYCSEGCKQKCGCFNVYLDPNRLSEFKKYNNKVYKETDKTVKKCSNKIKNIELRGNKHGYELDHKYTICDGFENDINPKIIAHWKNLEILTISENRKKNRNSSITLEELLNIINV